MSPELRFDSDGELEAFLVLATPEGMQFMDAPGICARDEGARQRSWLSVAARVRELEATAGAVVNPVWVGTGNGRASLDPERLESATFTAVDASGQGPQAVAQVLRDGERVTLSRAALTPAHSHFDIVGPLIDALQAVAADTAGSPHRSPDLGHLFRRPDVGRCPTAAAVGAHSSPSTDRSPAPPLGRETEAQTLGLFLSARPLSGDGEHQLSVFAFDAEGSALCSQTTMTFAGGRAVAAAPWEVGPAPLWTAPVGDVLARNRARRRAFNTVMAGG
jgi:hypothetical protein